MGIYLNSGSERFKESLNSYIYVDKPALLIELKYDKSAQSAINQIKDKNYLKFFEGYSGDVLLVGICYSKDTKTHECVIEKI